MAEPPRNKQRGLNYFVTLQRPGGGVGLVRLFPTGSRGENRRVFALHNLDSHVVCSADTDEQTT